MRKLFHRTLAIVLSLVLLSHIDYSVFANVLNSIGEGKMQTVSQSDSVSDGDELISLEELAIPMLVSNNALMLADEQGMTVTVEHYLGAVDENNMVFAPAKFQDVESGDVIEHVIREANGLEKQSVTVYDIVNGEKINGRAGTVNEDNELEITSSGSEMLVEVVYKETTGTYVNGVSMIDYDNGYSGSRDSGSINYYKNYEKYDNNEKADKEKYGSNRMGTIGASRDYPLNVSIGASITDKNGNAVAVTANANECQYKPYPVVKGLLENLTGANYETVNFKYDDPGFFSDAAKNGKTVVDGYKLEFSRTGMRYTLDRVLKANGNAVVTDLDYFFPLDKNGDKNMFFGMRYDFTFKLGDYIGNMEYSFVGDDDVWVCLNGDLILDLGGIHGKYPNSLWEQNPEQSYAPSSVNVWDYLYTEENFANKEDSLQNRCDFVQQYGDKTYTVTVLYMERGGNQSSCHMDFVMPNVVAAPPVINSTASLPVHKIDADTENALVGVEFSLTSGDTSYTAETDEAGNVIFSGLEKGTYTLTETKAKDGYLATEQTWTINVEETREGNKVTPYIESITPALESVNGYYVVENQALLADLEFAKIDSVTKSSLDGAEFALTDKDGNVKTAVSGENGESGKVKFEDLTIGEYTLTETVVPDGYAATADSWTVKVAVENGEAKARLYAGSSEITEIENVCIQIEITQDKTASVKDYANRIYTLDLKAAANAVTVKEADPIDLILSIDVSRSMLYPDKITDGVETTLNRLDTSKYYYYIKDPGSWDCVFVCWYAEGAWHEMDTSAWDYSQNAAGNATNSNRADATARRTYYLSEDYTSVLKTSGIGQNNPYDRMDKMKAAVADFVGNVADFSADSRIGIITYGGDSSECNREVRALTELNAANVKAIKSQISNLEVSPIGGTYTNYGLEQAKSMAASSEKDAADKYVLLITDGIPNFVLKNTAYKGENSIDEIGSIADDVAKKAHVMALGISLERVSYADRLMAVIASDDANYIYQIDDAESLKKAFKSILADIVVGRDVNVNVVDYIDPRFVLIDANGNVAETIIDEDGNTGVVSCDNGVYKVVWSNVNISGGWEAKFDVMAKEDFMGGNTILTNGPASGIYNVETGELERDFDDPTVNVKTLDISADNKVVEVFKGEDLTQNVYLRWLLDSISIAAEELTFEDTTTVEYSYPGTNDVVGKFTFEKSSETDKEWNEKQAYEQEVYKLKVTYTPCTVAERGTRGDAPVGAEAVAEDAVATYTVNVVEGSITINKVIDAEDYDATQGDPIFTFKIMKDGQFFAYETVRFVENADGVKTSDVVEITGLGKGTYTVEELDTIRFACENVEANGIGGYAADASADMNTKVSTIIIGYDEDGNASKRDAEVTLVNKKNNDRNFSDTDVVVNTCKFENGVLTWTGNDLTGN